MTPLTITLDLAANPWGDLPEDLVEVPMERLGCMPLATLEAKPAIYVSGTLPDGSTVVLSTTWALLHAAVSAIEARHGVTS